MAFTFRKLVFEMDAGNGRRAGNGENQQGKGKISVRFYRRVNLFKGTAAKEDRSIMNVPFTLPQNELTEKCLKEAKQNGLVQLKGHRKRRRAAREHL